MEDQSEPVHVFIRIRPELIDSDIRKQLTMSPGSPIASSVAHLGAGQHCITKVDDNTVKISAPDGVFAARKSVSAVDDKIFSFDRVFPENSTQEDIYSYVSEQVQATVRGYNTTIFAYGTTGSGKSYTMTGNKSAPGIIPRAIGDIFRIIEETARTENDVLFYVRLSYVELYNGSFRNLLENVTKDKDSLHRRSSNSSGGSSSHLNISGFYSELDDLETSIFENQFGTTFASARSRSTFPIHQHPGFDKRSEKIEVRESQSAGVFLAGPNLRIPVTSAPEAFQLIAKGNKIRHVGATQCNDVSSRSHAILTIHVESRHVVSGSGAGLGTGTVEEKAGTGAGNGGSAARTELRLGKIHLVDLAGSERLALSGAEGDTLKETQNINSSLSSLGDVLAALSRNANAMNHQLRSARQLSINTAGSNGAHVDLAAPAVSTHAPTMVPVPYRNSKLTHLLKDSLGGNSKTIMVTNIRTGAEYYQQTAISLMYASRAKKVRNRTIVNRNVTGDTGIHTVNSDIERLKKSLDERTTEYDRIRQLHVHDSKENLALKKRLQEMKEANERERGMLENQVSHVIHSQAGQLASQRQKISQLQGALQEELAFSQNRIAEQEKEIKWLKKALEEPQEHLNQMQGVVSKLKNEAESTKQEKEIVLKQAEQFQEINAKLVAKIAELEGTKKQLQDEVSARYQELNDLTTSMVQLSKANDSLLAEQEKRTPTRNYVNRIRQLEEEVESVKKRLLHEQETAKQHAASALKKVAELEKAKADLTEKLSSSVQALEERASGVAEQLRKKGESAKAAERRLVEKEEEKKQMEEQLREYKQRMENAVREKDKRIGQLEVALSSETSKSSQQDARLLSMEGMAEGFRDKIANLKSKLREKDDELAAQREEMQLETERLEKKLSVLMGNKDSETSALMEEFERILKGHRESIAEAERRAEEVQQQHEREVAELVRESEEKEEQNQRTMREAEAKVKLLIDAEISQGIVTLERKHEEDLRRLRQEEEQAREELEQALRAQFEAEKAKLAEKMRVEKEREIARVQDECMVHLGDSLDSQQKEKDLQAQKAMEKLKVRHAEETSRLKSEHALALQEALAVLRADLERSEHRKTEKLRQKLEDEIHHLKIDKDQLQENLKAQKEDSGRDFDRKMSKLTQKYENELRLMKEDHELELEAAIEDVKREQELEMHKFVGKLRQDAETDKSSALKEAEEKHLADMGASMNKLDAMRAAIDERRRLLEQEYSLKQQELEAREAQARDELAAALRGAEQRVHEAVQEAVAAERARLTDMHLEEVESLRNDAKTAQAYFKRALASQDNKHRAALQDALNLQRRDLESGTRSAVQAAVEEARARWQEATQAQRLELEAGFAADSEILRSKLTKESIEAELQLKRAHAAELERLAAEHRQEMEGLQERAASPLKRQLGGREAAIQQLQREIEDLHAKYKAEISSALAQQQADHDDLLAEETMTLRAQLQEQQDRHAAALTDIQAEHELQLAELREELGGAQNSAVRTLQDKIQHFKASNDSVQERLVDLQAEKEKELEAALREKEAEHQGRVAVLMQRVDELTEQLEAAGKSVDEERDNSQGVLKALEMQKDREAAQKVQAALDAAGAESAEKERLQEERCEELGQQVARLTALVEEKERANAQAEQQILALSAEIKERQEREKEEEERLLGRAERVDEAEKRAETVSRELECLRGELRGAEEALERALEQARAREGEVTGQLQEMQEKERQLAAQLSAVEAASAAQLSAVEAASAERREDLEQQIADLQDELDEMASALEREKIEEVARAVARAAEKSAKETRELQDTYTGMLRAQQAEWEKKLKTEIARLQSSAREKEEKMRAKQTEAEAKIQELANAVLQQKSLLDAERAGMEERGKQAADGLEQRHREEIAALEAAHHEAEERARATHRKQLQTLKEEAQRDAERAAQEHLDTIALRDEFYQAEIKAVKEGLGFKVQDAERETVALAEQLKEARGRYAGLMEKMKDQQEQFEKEKAALLQANDNSLTSAAALKEARISKLARQLQEQDAEHARQLEGLRAEMQAQREAAAEQREIGRRDAERELEELRQGYEASLQRARADLESARLEREKTAVAHAQETEALENLHKETMKQQLSAKDQAYTAQIEGIIQQNARDMAELQDLHAQEVQELAGALERAKLEFREQKREHSTQSRQKLRDLEQMYKEAVDTLEFDLDRERANAKKQADGAKAQLERVQAQNELEKAVLMESHKSNLDQIVAQHEREVAVLQQEWEDKLTAAVKEASEQAARERQQQEERAALLAAQTQAQLTEEREQHRERAEVLQRELGMERALKARIVESHQAQVRDLQAQVGDEAAAVAQEHANELQALTAKNEEQLRDLMQSHSREREEMERAAEQRVADVEAQLKAQTASNEERLAGLQAEHAAKMQAVDEELRRQQEEALTMRREHEKSIGELSARHLDALKAADAAHAQHLREELDFAEGRHIEEKQRQLKELRESLAEKHREDVQLMQLDASEYTKKLQAQVEQLQDEAAEKEGAAAQKLRVVAVEKDSAIARLQDELQAVRAQAERDRTQLRREAEERREEEVARVRRDLEVAMKEQLQTAREQAEAEVKAAKDAALAAEDENKDLKRQAAKQSALQASLAQEVDNLRQDKQQMLDQINALEVDIIKHGKPQFDAKLQVEKAKLEEAYKDEFEAVQCEVAGKLQEVRDLQAKVAQGEAEGKALRALAKKAEEDRDRAEQLFKALTAEREAAHEAEMKRAVEALAQERERERERQREREQLGGGNEYMKLLNDQMQNLARAIHDQQQANPTYKSPSPDDLQERFLGLVKDLPRLWEQRHGAAADASSQPPLYPSSFPSSLAPPPPPALPFAPRSPDSQLSSSLPRTPLRLLAEAENEPEKAARGGFSRSFPAMEPPSREQHLRAGTGGGGSGREAAWVSPGGHSHARSSPTDQLIAAILDGDVQGVRAVVRSKGEDLSSDFWRDLARSVLPLHRAVSGLHFHGSERLLVGTIETLAQLRADLNAADHAGNTVLHKAIQVCTSKSVGVVVQTLLHRGANPKSKNKDGDTPLHAECKRVRTASVSVIEALIVAGANPNSSCNPRGSSSADAITPLTLVLLRGAATTPTGASLIGAGEEVMLGLGLGSGLGSTGSINHNSSSNSSSNASVMSAGSAETDRSRVAGKRVWIRAAEVLVRSGAGWDAAWSTPGGCTQLHLLLAAFPPSREDSAAYRALVRSALDGGVNPALEDDRGRSALFVLCEQMARVPSADCPDCTRIMHLVLDGCAGAGIGASDRTGRTLFDILDSALAAERAAGTERPGFGRGEGGGGSAGAKPPSCLSACRQILLDAAAAAGLGGLGAGVGAGAGIHGRLGFLRTGTSTGTGMGGEWEIERPTGSTNSAVMAKSYTDAAQRGEAERKQRRSASASASGGASGRVGGGGGGGSYFGEEAEEYGVRAGRPAQHPRPQPSYYSPAVTSRRENRS